MHPWGGKGGKWAEQALANPEKAIGHFLGKLAQHHQKREEKKKRFKEELTQQMNEQMDQQLNQKMSEFTSRMQQQQQQIPQTDGSTQQIQQSDTTQKVEQIQQITPPPQPDQTPSQYVQSEIIFTLQPTNVQLTTIPNTVEKSLVESQIIESTSDIQKISEIKPSPETHKIIMIHSDQFSYPIIPYNEKYEDDESQLELKNSELQGIMVGQTKRELPQCDYYTKCKKHDTQIEYVCLEENCKQKNQYLMCPKCVKNHKQHNFSELSEIVFFGQQRMQQFEETDILIAKMQFEATLKLKLLKSKAMQELEDIGKKFEKGFEELKQQMLAQKEQYQQMMSNLQQGGLGNLSESINLMSEPSQNILQSSVYIKGFISKLQQAEQQLKQYEHLLFDQVTNIKKIKVDNYDFWIDFEKVQTFQDLYQQIKLQLIKEDKQSLIYRELIWLKENEAIKLQGNSQPVEQESVKDVQIISYQQF